jgi:hypothetical protein
LILQSLLPLSCGEPEGQQPDSGQDTDTVTDTDTGPPAFDCSAVPDLPLEITQMDGHTAWHDVAFTADGYMVGWDWSALLKMSYAGDVELLAPTVGELEGMDFLSNGDLIAADSAMGRLLRITEAGSVMNLSTGFSGEGNAIPYGVLVGPDGMVYAAGGPYVHRVDPQSGDRETLVELAGRDLRAVHFSLDFDLMYIAARTISGDVYAVELDDDLEPTGEPFVFTTGVGEDGSEAWHDGLGVDVCGNLYVPEFTANNLYRVSPEGDVELIVDWDHDRYGHNVKWGSGVGGWKDQSIYLPQPYNGRTVVEVDLGVPGHGW